MAGLQKSPSPAHRQQPRARGQRNFLLLAELPGTDSWPGVRKEGKKGERQVACPGPWAKQAWPAGAGLQFSCRADPRPAHSDTSPGCPGLQSVCPRWAGDRMVSVRVASSPMSCWSPTIPADWPAPRGWPHTLLHTPTLRGRCPHGARFRSPHFSRTVHPSSRESHGLCSRLTSEQLSSLIPRSTLESQAARQHVTGADGAHSHMPCGALAWPDLEIGEVMWAHNPEYVRRSTRKTRRVRSPALRTLSPAAPPVPPCSLRPGAGRRGSPQASSGERECLPPGDLSWSPSPPRCFQDTPPQQELVA